ncbi:MAG TPA: DUF362 domain-containing protein [Thermoanaerobaculaceae bacterium]|nr:DUF362 domain-containing protein [Thermoanaerobaculaceae bacterium]HPS76849.1 DUF362 domain-containing protein [Thermoanaerobaculaceae bacterium]
MSGIEAPVRDRQVVVGHDPSLLSYPCEAPYHPSEPFPELQAVGCPVGIEPNPVFRLVRSCLGALDLDLRRRDTQAWNPLGELIRPGDRVLVKVNLVVDSHELGDAGLQATIVHGSVLRAVLEYVALALSGRGMVTVADSPIKETDFGLALDRSGCAAAIAHLAGRGLGIRALDLRDYATQRDARGVMSGHRPLAGDPDGYVVFNLGDQSFFADPGVDPTLLRSTAEFYTSKCKDAHDHGDHRYSVARAVIDADVLISLAKLKVHRKAGTTLSQKNMVGTTNLKEWLPHHRWGTPRHGGDVLDDGASALQVMRELLHDRLARTPFGRHTRGWLLGNLSILESLPGARRRFHPWGEGDWSGNDTIWRTLLDLNNCVLHGTPDGRLGDRRKRYMAWVDGIIGGEREGPLSPHPHPAGLIVAGWHPWAVDWVATEAMGWEPARLPYLARCRDSRYRLAPDFEARDIDIRRVGPVPKLCFAPPAGWRAWWGRGAV